MTATPYEPGAAGHGPLAREDAQNMTTAQEATAGLRTAAAGGLSRNDLGRLAQMHSWAQALGETELPGTNPSADQAVRRLAQVLVELLERIILDEAADANAGLALLPEIADLLDVAGQGQTVDIDPVLARAATVMGSASKTVCAAPPPLPTVAALASASAVPQPAVCEPPVPSAPASASQVEPYISEPLVLDLDEREHLDGFLAEAAEHMDAIEAGLLAAEANLSDGDKLNELFRPFHTIKGIAGFLNLRDINRLTHEIETILDLGRKGTMRITTTTVDLIFSAVDALKAQLAAIRQYLAAPSGPACPQPDIAAVMAELRRVAAGLDDAGPSDARPRLGEVLVAEGLAAESDVSAALGIQTREPPPPRRLGQILVAEGVTSETQVRRALAQQGEGAKTLLDTSIRVGTAKLDALVDAIGELVIAQAMVGLHPKIREDEKLLRSVAQVGKIVRDVQETTLAMRMVPIGNTFQKMRRLVRDVAQKAGRRVDLVITGEETELDKNVIQQISDPLVHLVRNAVDHGIEPPEMRRQLGKPETGRVQLNAFHQGDSIVIEIRDDGKGLDRKVLIAKGAEKGLVSADEPLTEQQVFALILQPGFSTAEKITDISGRGVGLDVVKRNVEQLRGKIEIHSKKGQGSTFSIRLPLTLAIIDGMLLRVGHERMIVPTILVEQSLRPTPKQITSVQGRGQMLQVRGELCPLIQLGALFDCGPPVDPCANLVVIAQSEGPKIALVVSELIGQQQVVIKSLNERFKGVQGVSGAAILGDGRVGLILEPSGVLKLHNTRHCATFQRAPLPIPAAVRDAASLDAGRPAPLEPATAGV